MNAAPAAGAGNRPSRRARAVQGALLGALLAAVACAPAPGPDPAPNPPETPVATAESVVLAVKGDWGHGTPEQAEITARMCAVRAERPFETVITTGDNFSRPEGVATAQNYHQPEACLIGYPGHRWRAVWGNHDVRGDATATVLGAVDRYYSFREGPAEFFMLDSNRAGDAGQQAWLSEQLQASRAPVRIAVFHHPPFTVSLHPGDAEVQQHWVPLFEEYGVDLVLSGHSHAYEHAVAGGIHYVITGGGGAPLYPCVDDQPWLRTCLVRHHFLLLEVTDSLVAVTALGSQGETLDRFEVPINR